MTAQLSPTPIFKGWDNNGLPLAFGLLNTYVAGTTTPQATYTDSTQTTQNPNPVVLNARGEAAVWLDPTKTYKLVLTDSSSNQIWTSDQINGALSPSSSVIPSVDNVYSLGSTSNRWANVYAYQNYYFGSANNALVSASGNAVYFAKTSAETAASVTPTDYSYPPGDLRRYGGDATGATYSDTAMASAISTGHLVTADESCTFKFSSSIGIKTNTKIDLHNASLNFANDTDGFANNTGASVLYTDIQNCVLNVAVNNTHAALNLVDVSRSRFSNIRFSRSVTATGWGYGIVLNSSASVCLWNAFFGIIAECVNKTFISIAGTSNENRFYSAQLINIGSGGGDRSIPNASAAVWINNGSGNRFYGLELESVMSTTSDMLRFDAGAVANTVIGLHTEAYSGSGTSNAINWNGGTKNTVIGHYALGYTNLSTGTIAGNSWLDCDAVGNTLQYLQQGVGLAIPVHSGGGGQSGTGVLSYDSTDDRLYGSTSAGGSRKIVQSPALDNQDLNGNSLANVSTMTLTGSASSPGAGKVNIGSSTATTVGAAGGASALPATPLGYLIAFVGTTQVKIPYFNN